MNRLSIGRNFPTIDAFYDRLFQRYEDNVAIQSASQSVTYAELDRQSSKMANVLVSLGLGVDDRVGILMENRIEYLVTQIACVRAGVVSVPLNSQLTESELKAIFEDSQLETLVVGTSRFKTVQSLQQNEINFNHLIGVTDEGNVPIGFHSYSDLLSKADPTAPNIDQQSDDVVAVYYTGGTTGQPKGAMHTHAGLILNIYSHIYELYIRRDEKMLLVTPLGHSAGFFARAALAQGGKIILHSNFDADAVLETLVEEQVSWVYLIPTMIADVLDSVDSTNFNADSLETIAYGSAPISSGRLKEGVEVFGNVFVQFYGLAEIPNLVTVLPKANHDPDEKEWLESAGIPTQLANVKVFDDENEWGDNVGEVGIRAPYQMLGYLNRDERLSDRDWIRTGDVGQIDDQGRLHILDRIQDVIISNGKPVYSTAVEDVIQRHPDVKQVAVIGIPENQEAVAEPMNRRQVEQSVKAIIVPTDEDDVRLTDVRSFCEGKLKPWQLPDSIDSVGQLPETPYGKIDKRLLREPYW